MSSPRIQSSDDLKEYILRQLGSPVVNIEITDEQLDDVIFDTIDEYCTRAYSGVIERFIPVQLIVDPLTNDYILPYSVFAVLEVLGLDTLGMGATSSAQPFSMGQFIAADLYKPGTAKIDLIGYEMINEMLATVDLLFSQKISFDFNSISKVLHLNSVPTSVDKVMLRVFQKLDLQGTAVSGSYAEQNIFNEMWIKKMSAAKAQMQWGKNISKYQGSTLPNGGSLNSDFIYNEAKDQVEKLNEQLRNEYEIPPDMMIG